MKELKILFLAAVCTASSAVFAIEVPQQVQAAFDKVCPDVADEAWSADEGYYVATFNQNQFETKLWFDGQGNWVMEQVDWETMSDAPAAIFNAFAAGQYSGNEVQDVVQIQYPQRETMVAVLVGTPNEESGYMLLYNENGELIEADAVSISGSNCLGACNLLECAVDD